MNLTNIPMCTCRRVSTSKTSGVARVRTVPAKWRPCPMHEPTSTRPSPTLDGGREDETP